MRLLRVGLGRMLRFVGFTGNPIAAPGSFIVTEDFSGHILTEGGDNIVTE